MNPHPNLRGKRAIVVGAGVGGLAAAIQLARAGLAVRLYERAPHVGGKLRQLEVGGRTFDAGPSVFTMKYVFDELFGGRTEDWLELHALDPLCRHWFADGSRLDLFTDEERSRDAIQQFAGAAAARGYSAYRRHAAKIFSIVRGPFMERAVPSGWSFLHPKMLLQMMQIDGRRTLWKALEDFFPDERLRQLFGRYATYNGSSPYHAPATLAVIAHVENAFGIWSCTGGIYRLAEALAARARELGVEIATGVEVARVDMAAGRASGVHLAGGGHERADLVVANADVAHVYGAMLEGVPGAAKLATTHAGHELSLSAYVMLAVARRGPDELVHHNVFFARDYKREFDELVKQRRAPEDATVYLCAQDRPDGKPPAGAHERVFFLTNAPALQGAGASIDWDGESPRCRARIVRTLARHGWTFESEAERALTPREWARDFPSSRGAIYGLSSNSAMAAFKRPTNKLPKLPGLYLVGGTVHPGAGMPMVALSAKIATREALADLGVPQSA